MSPRTWFVAWTLVYAVVLGWVWGALALYLAVVSAWLVHVLTTRHRPPQEV